MSELAEMFAWLYIVELRELSRIVEEVNRICAERVHEAAPIAEPVTPREAFPKEF
jgi:hypothetical protein